ncbi:MAG: peptide chain release factor 2 [Nitrospirae bacterium]|nr:peptide chain release factor 2 [Nitrospirota bacterium]
MLEEEKTTLNALMTRMSELRGHLDLPGLQSRLQEIESRIAAPDFWNNAQVARKVSQEKTHIEKTAKKWERLEQLQEDLSVLLQLSDEQADASLHPEIAQSLKTLQDEIRHLEVEMLLSGDKDLNSAIVAIHPGAGGTESQDWAQMLFRMYNRWAERNGYKVELIDFQPGEEAGIKSATFSVIGDYAYGHLKAEAGVHRLVRISPFDANKRRHTSFSSVFVYPDIEDDAEIELDEKEIKMDAFRSSGPGGQNVNKVSSAVRLTHIPTGIVVACQTERSQHKNRSMAMKLLRAKLYELEQEKKEKEMSSIVGEKKEIAWGNQIRSYVFQPYQMVKDHRTNTEVGNVSAVMDGEIDEFINAYLVQSMRTSKRT